jgi:hypothetical protein
VWRPPFLTKYQWSATPTLPIKQPVSSRSISPELPGQTLNASRQVRVAQFNYALMLVQNN